MTTETTTTDETDFREEAEGLAEAAERLAQQHKLDAQTPNEPTIKRYPVYGADHDDRTLEFTILVGPDTTETVSVPWPDDTQDETEPLVRLANAEGVSLRNLTNFETVPVVTDGEQYNLLVPPHGNRSDRVFNAAPWLFTTYVDTAARRSLSVEARIRPLVLALASGGCAAAAAALVRYVLPVQDLSVLAVFSPDVLAITLATVFVVLAITFGAGAVARTFGKV